MVPGRPRTTGKGLYFRKVQSVRRDVLFFNPAEKRFSEVADKVWRTEVFRTSENNLRILYSG